VPARYYKSEAPAAVLEGRLRNALVRLLSAARNVQSLADMRSVAVDAKTPAPRTYDLVEEHVQGAYKRLRRERAPT
jgi:hypothetical protein